MRKIVFGILFGIFVFAGSAFAMIDISNISNPNGWQFTTHQTTFTVGQDGRTLFYRGKSTGMTLNTPGTPGGQIVVRDPSIPPRTRGGGGGGGGGGTGVTAGQVIKSGIGVAAGLMVGAEGVDMSADANAAGTEKKTWADVGKSTVAGGATAAGTAMIVNVIPVGGQVAYGVMVAAGAAIGAFATARKIFSETDCEKDPVRGIYACCNISNLSNIKAFRASIGQQMWTDTFPYVRTCMQGKYTTEQDWLTARFLDDHWGKGFISMCSGYPEPTDPAHVVPVAMDPKQNNKSLCWAWICEDGWVPSGTVCVPESGGGNGGPVGKTCVEKRNNANGKACCSLPVSLAVYDSKADKCICAGNAEFGIDANGRGYCKTRENTDIICPDGSIDASTAHASCLGKGTFVCTKYADGQMLCLCGKCDLEVDKTYNCDKAKMGLVDKWLEDCATNSGIVKTLKMIKEYCAEDGRTKEGFDAYWDSLMVMQPDKCLDKTSVIISDARVHIESSVDALRGLTSVLGVSKWKNAQGKFNTARLASDMTAGVVLGTAGALITSHLVKKHQVEDGFEDLQCTIGGQTVANWGDEFSVGIQ